MIICLKRYILALDSESDQIVEVRCSKTQGYSYEIRVLISYWTVVQKWTTECLMKWYLRSHGTNVPALWASGSDLSLTYVTMLVDSFS